MAENYIVPSERLSAIADAIREKAGSADGITLANMPTMILDLGDGGGDTPEPVTYTLSATGRAQFTSTTDTSAATTSPGSTTNPNFKRSIAGYNRITFDKNTSGRRVYGYAASGATSRPYYYARFYYVLYKDGSAVTSALPANTTAGSYVLLEDCDEIRIYCTMSSSSAKTSESGVGTGSAITAAGSQTSTASLTFTLS